MEGAPMQIEQEVDRLGARIEAMKIAMLVMSRNLPLQALHEAGREMNEQAEALTAVALGSRMSDAWREELAMRLREFGSAWSTAQPG